MRRLPAIAAVLLAALTVRPAAAIEDYDACVALAAENPEQAADAAARWAEAGGGAPARHCRALALRAMGAERHAAVLMADIATTDRTLPTQVRADMLVEAGRIWLGLGEIEAAGAAADRAARIAPDPRGAWVLAARLSAEENDWQGARDQLTRAIDRGQPDAAALILRASARRHLGDLAGARSDLDRAAALAPEDPELWLELGALAAANGERDAARVAFLKAIDLDRDGPVAPAARLSLQRMEAGLEADPG